MLFDLPRYDCRCSIFGTFDTCLLLSSGGNVVYSGPQRLALPYMAFLGFYIPPNENLADFLLDVISGAGWLVCWQLQGPDPVK